MIDAAGGADAALPDASAPADASIDAQDPDTLRSGTIAVSEVSVSNPGLPMPLEGAVISAAYTDLASVTVAPTYDPMNTGSAPIGDCAVWVYNVGADQEPAAVDEGPITISGGLSPIGTCVFSEAAGDYVCPFAEGTVTEGAGLVFAQANGTVTVTWPGDEFAGKDVRGMYVRFEGFTNAGNNGLFPIVNKSADSTLVVANPDGATEIVEAGSAPTYTVLAGAGPTPAAREFLDDTTQITVQKEAGAVVAALQAAVEPSGNGLTLDNTSARPHQFPSIAQQDITFSCSGTGGVCGPSPDAADAIYGFVLSGRTTDGDISGLQTGFDTLTMPEAASQYTVFQCRGEIRGDSVTIPQAALETILSTKPNRIEVRLLRITADLTHPQTSIVVGHGLVGYTDTNLSPAP